MILAYLPFKKIYRLHNWKMHLKNELLENFRSSYNRAPEGRRGGCAINGLCHSLITKFALDRGWLLLRQIIYYVFINMIEIFQIRVPYTLPGIMSILFPTWFSLNLSKIFSCKYFNLWYARKVLSDFIRPNVIYRPIESSNSTGARMQPWKFQHTNIMNKIDQCLQTNMCLAPTEVGILSHLTHENQVWWSYLYLLSKSKKQNIEFVFCDLNM